MLSPVPDKLNLPKIDHEMLDFWEKNDVFQKSIDQHDGREDYVFFDGPPGTNGVPHIGHMMQSALKDLWPRYKTMKGYRVLRKAGWDTHGLPVEMTADKDLGFKSRLDVVDFGEQKYIDHCRKTVFRYKETWETAIYRLGRFLDLEHAYATYLPYYIQSDWWTLKQAWNLELEGEAREQALAMGQSPRYLYRDYRIMPYSPRSGATLSNFEVAQGYQDVTDMSLFVKFRVKGEANTYLAAWTTTPWTLLSNIAVAAGPNIEYTKIELTEDCEAGKAGEKWILAFERLRATEPYFKGYKVLGSMKGTELAGIRYEGLFDWLEGLHPEVNQVFVDNYVTTEDGTGLVHLACYGEDDLRIIRANGLPIVLAVNADGMVEDFAGEFAGRWFRDEELDVDVIKSLHARGLLLGKEKFTHSYPFDYRSGAPLMYFPRPAWFLRMSAMRDMMIEANRRIGWKPEHMRDGRFGNWLENIQDWNVTRERYWGSPLPVWQTEDVKESVCFASIAELSEAVERSTGKPLPKDFDPHKPQIDQIVLKTVDGREMRRENFVLDSWFNAGLMPWGQWGYPSEPGSDERFMAQYPCDFICEGLDQTRGWFYTLLACSCLVAKAKMKEAERAGETESLKFWSNPVNWSSYKNVICTGLILDHNGQKMSKSVGNIVEPVDLFERFGADPCRWIFYASNPWISKRFGEEEIREAVRAAILPLWNSYSFFVTYARIDEWKPARAETLELTQLDHWILSEYNRLIEDLTGNLDRYDVAPAAAAIIRFLDLLTNWYIRRSRRRFWKSESDVDKATAYSTLYEVLVGLTHLLAPFLPFVTEHIYQNLARSYDESAPVSVHLATYPEADKTKRDVDLETNMERVRNAVTLARALRQERNLKVRQPLPQLTWVLPETEAPADLDGFLPMIGEEINVRDVRVIHDDAELVEVSATANFRVLGKRVGGKMKDVAAAIANLTPEQISRMEAGTKLELMGFEIGMDDIQVKKGEREGLAIQTDGGMTVALDTTLTPELIAEGLAREVVHHIQNLRKQSGFEITDRIELDLSTGSEVLLDAVRTHQEYIRRETLATELRLGDSSGGTEFTTGEHTFVVNARRTDGEPANMA